MSKDLDAFEIGGKVVERGETRDLSIAISQSYTGAPVRSPIRVIRAARAGPVVFVSAALHGDELNGVGIVREIIMNPPFELSAGTLILAPVLNVLGFEGESRYTPDRRDLNRSFPGSATGPLASRIANLIFSELVLKCDYGIDLHSAAVRRTNFPNVRANLEIKEVETLALAFGCELVVHGTGPIGSLRRCACEAGVPTIILEAGEVWKIEPGVVRVGIRGIRNALISLSMAEGEREEPAFEARIKRTSWIRAQIGGLLQFHVAPGEIVKRGQPIATNASLLGQERNVLVSPVNGVILGMTTMPAVKPGDPVCNIAIPSKGVGPIRRALSGDDDASLHEQLVEDLATNIHVLERDGDDLEAAT